MNARRTPKPPLTTTQLAMVARAALDNAAALLSDAQLLLKAGRWPRAYALAILAAEEYGKFQSCVVAAAHEPDDHKTWAKFWQDFTSHKPKFTAWGSRFLDQLAWEDGPEGDAEWKLARGVLPGMVERGTSGKLHALYVDFEDDKLLVPAELFSEEAADTTITLVASVIIPATKLFKGDLTRLVDPSPALKELFKRMKAVDSATPADRDAAIAAAQEQFERVAQQVDIRRGRANLTTGEDSPA